jgi:hypothetical protein
LQSLRSQWVCSASVLPLKAQKAKAKKEAPRQAHFGARPAAQHQTPWHQGSYQVPWGQAPRQQYQDPWPLAPQRQRPQQRFVLANHSGTYKSKPKQVRRPQKMQEEQYSGEPPIWMQTMMEWTMQYCQQPLTGRTWVEKDSYHMRGNRRT